MNTGILKKYYCINQPEYCKDVFKKYYENVNQPKSKNIRSV